MVRIFILFFFFFSPMSDLPAGVVGQGDVEETCECVNHYICDEETKRIIESGGGVIDWRISGKKCPVPGEVCCKLPLSVIPTSEPVREPDIITKRMLCGERKKTKKKGDPMDFDWGFKVAGGDETHIGEFPWMLMIYYSHPDPGVIPFYVCGASLLLSNVALTAAHCIKGKKPEELMVRAGEWDNSQDGEEVQDRRVKRIEVHPQFSMQPPMNDIAVLFLETDFDLNENINTICLPEEGVLYDGDKCVGTGWGLNGEGDKGQEQPRLRKAELPIVPFPICEKMLRIEIKKRNEVLANRFVLHDNFVCAGSEKGKDLCKGDGGGPLVCKAHSPPERFVQVGVTSWGLGCARKDVPGVYTDVNRLQKWILNTIHSVFQS